MFADRSFNYLQINLVHWNYLFLTS